MPTLRCLGLPLLMVLLVPAPAPAGEPPADPSKAVALTLDGPGLAPKAWTVADFRALPRQSVTARGHDGMDSKYEGVALVEFLQSAGAPLGKELRGKAVSLYLVVEAADGYRAVFALPEVDPAFSDRVVLLADRRDGQPLSPKEGPLQVIVPGEKRHSRWVRQVVALRLGKA